MSFVSCAQNLEDVVLWKALKNVNNGFYIDVGANDPIIDSTTRAFYQRGWRGINIEPVHSHYEALVSDRPEDINLHCALHEKAGESAIWECSVRGWATLSKTVSDIHEKDGHQGRWHKVTVKRLVDICDEHHCQEIHFLKIDVEGEELSVLKGNDWNKYRPWIIVVEASYPNTQLDSYFEIEKLLLENNYLFAYADGLNRFYLAHEHSELLVAFKYPPNVFDDYQTYKEFNAITAVNKITEDFDNFKQAIGKLLLENITNLQDNVTEALISEEISDSDKLLFTIKSKMARLISGNEKLSTSNQQLQLSYSALLKSHVLLEREISRLNKSIDDIYQSTSWRFSAPIRFFGAKYKILKTKCITILNMIIAAAIRVLSKNPSTRRHIVKMIRKIGLYHFLRKLYLRALSGSVAKIPCSVAHSARRQEKTLLSFYANQSLTIDTLHKRIKNEIVAWQDKREKQ